MQDHAVVLGGSIAGLLAARVLAETYSQVTVLDRDALATGVAPRRGAPQGRSDIGRLRPTSGSHAGLRRPRRPQPTSAHRLR